VGTAAEILAGYVQLAATVGRMVVVARAGRWDDLPALDAACTALFDQLVGLQVRPMTPYEHARLRALEERIRADQDELTGLLQPEFLRLMQRMREVQRAQAAEGARRMPS
jgi:hypothetical protein